MWSRQRRPHPKIIDSNKVILSYRRIIAQAEVFIISSVYHFHYYYRYISFVAAKNCKSLIKKRLQFSNISLRVCSSPVAKRKA